MRALPQMSSFGYPIIFDATHSVQQPGGLGLRSGGQREFVPTLSRAAVSVGVSGLFIEVHENPDKAPSITAVVPLPGIPNVSKGTNEPEHAALLAVSGAAIPFTLPLPNFCFSSSLTKFLSIP